MNLRARGVSCPRPDQDAYDAQVAAAIAAATPIANVVANPATPADPGAVDVAGVVRPVTPAAVSRGEGRVPSLPRERDGRSTTPPGDSRLGRIPDRDRDLRR